MIGYLDPVSGISGDMMLGCLVGAGWPIGALEDTIRALALPEDAWAVSSRRVMKGAIQATLVDVQVQEAGQPHRHLRDIRTIIEASALPEQVKADALAVFTRLAEAEGAVHGVDAEAVHFHEVGALDSIIDIVGVCAGIHALGLTLYAAPLPLGHGYIQSQHGLIPLPAPATLEMIAHAGAPVKAAPGPGELVTPTGAALVLHFVQNRWFLPPMTLQKIGTGAGQKEFDWPNLARLWVGELTPSRAAPHHLSQTTFAPLHGPHDHAEGHHAHDAPVVTRPAPHATGHDHATAAAHPHTDGHSHARTMSLLETNIDDMNPEFYQAVGEKLLASGARDVWYSPIHMKKNRPGIKLSVLVAPDAEAQIAQLILRETTTLGMRVLQVGRHEAHRRMERVVTPYGEIAVKLKILGDEIVAAVPEYEDCKRAAHAHNVSLREVYEAAAAVAWQAFVAQGHRQQATGDK